MKSQKHAKNMKAIFDIYKNEHSTVFEVAYYESEAKMTKNKMADPIWAETYAKKISDLVRTWYCRVFEVTEYESEVKWQKTKWRIQYGGPVSQKISDFVQTWYSRVFEVAEYECI